MRFPPAGDDFHWQNSFSFQVKKLRERYTIAEERLAARTGKSDSAKEKAQRLYDRASQLYVSTNAKEKELKGIGKKSRLISHLRDFYLMFFFTPDLESAYQEKDSILHGLTEDMRTLSAQMDDYVAKISSRSKYYSDCVS